MPRGAPGRRSRSSIDMHKADSDTEVARGSSQMERDDFYGTVQDVVEDMEQEDVELVEGEEENGSGLGEVGEAEEEEDDDDMEEEIMEEEDSEDTDDTESDHGSPIEEGATLCRLPPKEMNPDEATIFPNLAKGPKAMRDAYLYLRNTCCMLWVEEPVSQLVNEKVLDEVADKTDAIPILEEAGLLPRRPVTETESEGEAVKNNDDGWSPWTAEAQEKVRKLIEKILTFLERYGYINFGKFSAVRPALTITPKSDFQVIVIGAGVAGLFAARHLQYFGCKVTVLESRDRIGGRIWTFRHMDYVADLGAMVVTGIVGNPLEVLSKQIPLDLMAVKPTCPLYDAAGNLIPKEKDEPAEAEFNRLLSTAAHICHSRSLDSLDEQPLSLGETIELLVKFQEKHTRVLKLEHMELQEKLLTKKSALLEKMAVVRLRIQEAYSRWAKADEEAKKSCECTSGPANATLSVTGEMVTAPTVLPTNSGDTLSNASGEEKVDAGSNSTSSPDQENVTPGAATNEVPKRQTKGVFQVNGTAEFTARRLLKELTTAWNEFEPLENEHADIEKKMKLLEENTPPDVYLTATDRHLLDWHLANLEFANATHLDNLSLRHWDQDDQFEFPGEHFAVRNGYSALTTGMAESLHVELKTSVKRIHYDNDEVVVEAINTALSEDETVSYRADAVVCTLPLGVLKETLNNPQGCNAPQFNPPLPEWKTAAIKRLGFGVLNKVILCFERCFWDRQLSVFGHMNAQTAERGEFFLFWSLYERPVLIALIAGKAAVEFERHNFTKEEVVARVMTVLKGVYKTVPQPIGSYVTKWHQDIDSRGSYSYVAVGASGDDYDLLAAPVPAEGSSGPPRVFFAGEHTIRHYPATVHGALLSGLRQAANIAEKFFPGNLSDEECVNGTAQ